MASATGVPERVSRDSTRIDESAGLAESEPLLGRPGDAVQHDGQSILNNLVLGTGILAELGIVLLVALIWASVFTKPLIIFSGHPLAMSTAIFILVQSILMLQPTETPRQKSLGRHIHAGLNLLAFLAIVTGVTFIEYNKIKNKGPHMHSVHSYFGFVTAIIIVIQYLVGFTMWMTPGLYGGEERAKSLYKYHRYSGYTIFILLLATVCAATETDYNQNVLHLKLWATVLLSVITVAGVLPRIQKRKLGLGRSQWESDGL